VVDNFPYSYPYPYKIRKQLCSDGIIANRILQRDYEFDNLSLAVSVILCRKVIG